jgi:hypothetical protein
MSEAIIASIITAGAGLAGAVISRPGAPSIPRPKEVPPRTGTLRQRRRSLLGTLAEDNLTTTEIGRKSLLGQ